MSKKFNPWARHQSRRALVQALYQWQLTAALTEDLEQQFLKDTKPRRFDREFFSKVGSSISQMVKADKEEL